MTYTPSPARGECSSGKVQFANRRQARSTRKRMGDSSLAVYRCHCGWWHLGHVPRRVRNGDIDKAAWLASKGIL